ncbi:hypothetical protein NQ317_012421 [Molorchus minor]|uniref:Uncharacterized protein n=1 Tax=Molorchus minor TaxID=1323400 RepID=A0ABQ9JC23_9CUCU|nr:hypothetical protein NQ317_012421 [Molorchus minor]
MMPKLFYILEGIKENIYKQSNFRECISPEEKLAVTLSSFGLGCGDGVVHVEFETYEDACDDGHFYQLVCHLEL